MPAVPATVVFMPSSFYDSTSSDSGWADRALGIPVLIAIGFAVSLVIALCAGIIWKMCAIRRTKKKLAALRTAVEGMPSVQRGQNARQGQEARWSASEETVVDIELQRPERAVRPS